MSGAPGPLLLSHVSPRLASEASAWKIGRIGVGGNVGIDGLCRSSKNVCIDTADDAIEIARRAASFVERTQNHLRVEKVNETRLHEG